MLHRKPLQVLLALVGVGIPLSLFLGRKPHVDEYQFFEGSFGPIVKDILARPRLPIEAPSEPTATSLLAFTPQYHGSWRNIECIHQENFSSNGLPKIVRICSIHVCNRRGQTDNEDHQHGLQRETNNGLGLNSGTVA